MNTLDSHQERVVCLSCWCRDLGVKGHQMDTIFCRQARQTEAVFLLLLLFLGLTRATYLQLVGSCARVAPQEAIAHVQYLLHPLIRAHILAALHYPPVRPVVQQQPHLVLAAHDESNIITTFFCSCVLGCGKCSQAASQPLDHQPKRLESLTCTHSKRVQT